MKIRQGMCNPHALWIQVGDEPSKEHDISIGYIRLPAVARWLVMELDGTQDAYQFLPEALGDEHA